jgi:hypothetical protein
MQPGIDAFRKSSAQRLLGVIAPTMTAVKSG